METLAHRTLRHIVDDPGEDINPWSDDTRMDACLPGWPHNSHCTMSDLLQSHILLQDNAHDLPQHYLHTYFIHPNLCHWPPALSPSHLMPHSSILSRLSFFFPLSTSSKPFYSLSYIMHFSDWVIHHNYIYRVLYLTSVVV